MRTHTVILTLSLCLCFAIGRSSAQEGPAVVPTTRPAYARNDSTLQTHPEEAASGIAPQEGAASAARSFSRSERGLTSLSNRFVPKGQWVFGIAASYSTHTNDDYTFLVIDDINSDGYTFKITPFLSYALRDNMAVGVRFTYSRSLLRIDGGRINVGEEDTGIDIGVDFYNALQHNYSGAVIWRQYIPLGQNRRFALFNEMSLSLGGGQARFAADSPVRGTYSTSFTGSLGISPGLVAFATNNLAFEVNVGVMGISYTRTRQIHNRVTSGTQSSGMINFKVNILSIGLGVSFYM